MAIRFLVEITASSEVVYEALTTNRGFHGWWTATCDIDCAVGHESSIRFEKEGLTEEMVFETLAAIRNKKLVWCCMKNNVFPSWVGTTLTFQISVNDAQVTLDFLQKSENSNWKKHPDYQSSKNGWDFFMGSLKDYCETGQGQPWEDG